MLTVHRAIAAGKHQNVPIIVCGVAILTHVESLPSKARPMISGHIIFDRRQA